MRLLKEGRAFRLRASALGQVDDSGGQLFLLPRMIRRQPRKSFGAPSDADGQAQQDGQQRDSPQGRPQPPCPLIYGHPDAAEKTDGDQPHTGDGGRDRFEPLKLQRRVGQEGADD